MSRSALVALLALLAGCAGTLEPEFATDELRKYAVDAHLLDPREPLEPTSALATAKLAVHYLAQGKLEEVALLSNAPKARYERLRDALGDWKPEDFKRAYEPFFDADSWIVGEVAQGPHHLIMWRRGDIGHIAGYLLVEIDGKYFLDDVPSPERSRLRRVLQSFRAGEEAPLTPSARMD
jgi:hypothetical protein